MQLYLPNAWKIHKIIPVFKAGDPSLVKIIIPFLYDPTHTVLKQQNHWSCQQMSPSIWLHQELLNITTDADQVINSSLQTDVIYFDISKAFE